MLQCVYVFHGLLCSLFQYFQILIVMLIESITHMNKTLQSFLNSSFLSKNKDVPITGHSHSLHICALICAALYKCIPGPFPSIFRDFFVVVFCSVTVILGHNWNLNQAPEKGSIALGASDSVSQTFNRPASYINIRQECPNDIHRAIIYFPVISLWHKLDLMKEEGENLDLFN